MTTVDVDTILKRWDAYGTLPLQLQRAETIGIIAKGGAGSRMREDQA
jgi:hypothetical protein